MSEVEAINERKPSHRLMEIVEITETSTSHRSNDDIPIAVNNISQVGNNSSPLPDKTIADIKSQFSKASSTSTVVNPSALLPVTVQDSEVSTSVSQHHVTVDEVRPLFYTQTSSSSSVSDYGGVSLEAIRALKRRETNRKAAQKCRQKQSEKEQILRQQFMHFESTNTQLKAEIHRLIKAKNQLEQILIDHREENCVYQVKGEDQTGDIEMHNEYEENANDVTNNTPEIDYTRSADTNTKNSNQEFIKAGRRDVPISKTMIADKYRGNSAVVGMETGNNDRVQNAYKKGSEVVKQLLSQPNPPTLQMVMSMIHQNLLQSTGSKIPNPETTVKSKENVPKMESGFITKAPIPAISNPMEHSASNRVSQNTTVVPIQVVNMSNIPKEPSVSAHVQKRYPQIHPKPPTSMPPVPTIISQASNDNALNIPSHKEKLRPFGNIKSLRKIPSITRLQYQRLVQRGLGRVVAKRKIEQDGTPMTFYTVHKSEYKKVQDYMKEMNQARKVKNLKTQNSNSLFSSSPITEPGSLNSDEPQFKSPIPKKVKNLKVYNITHAQSQPNTIPIYATALDDNRTPEVMKMVEKVQRKNQMIIKQEFNPALKVVSQEAKNRNAINSDMTNLAASALLELQQSIPKAQQENASPPTSTVSIVAVSSQNNNTAAATRVTTVKHKDYKIPLEVPIQLHVTNPSQFNQSVMSSLLNVNNSTPTSVAIMKEHATTVTSPPLTSQVQQFQTSIVKHNEHTQKIDEPKIGEPQVLHQTSDVQTKVEIPSILHSLSPSTTLSQGRTSRRRKTIDTDTSVEEIPSKVVYTMSADGSINNTG